MEMELLCAKALEKWGADAQIEMCIEECAELIDALCKYRRGRCGQEHVAEEIVDVVIMMGQMSILFDLHLLDEWFDRKQQRLREKLNS